MLCAYRYWGCFGPLVDRVQCQSGRQLLYVTWPRRGVFDNVYLIPPSVWKTCLWRIIGSELWIGPLMKRFHSVGRSQSSLFQGGWIIACSLTHSIAESESFISYWIVGRTLHFLVRQSIHFPLQCRSIRLLLLLARLTWNWVSEGAFLSITRVELQLLPTLYLLLYSKFTQYCVVDICRVQLLDQCALKPAAMVCFYLGCSWVSCSGGSQPKYGTQELRHLTWIQSFSYKIRRTPFCISYFKKLADSPSPWEFDGNVWPLECGSSHPYPRVAWNESERTALFSASW